MAKNENFQAFVGEVAATVLASDVTDLEAAKALPKGDETLEGFIKTKVLEMGENLQFRRFERLTLTGEGARCFLHSPRWQGGCPHRSEL